MYREDIEVYNYSFRDCLNRSTFTLKNRKNVSIKNNRNKSRALESSKNRSQRSRASRSGARHLETDPTSAMIRRHQHRLTKHFTAAHGSTKRSSQDTQISQTLFSQYILDFSVSVLLQCLTSFLRVSFIFCHLQAQRKKKKVFKIQSIQAERPRG